MGMIRTIPICLNAQSSYEVGLARKDLMHFTFGFKVVPVCLSTCVQVYKATIDEVREVAVKMAIDRAGLKADRAAFWREISMIAELRCAD